MENEKVIIGFTSSEIISLIDLINKRKENLHVQTLALQFDSGIKKKLIDALSEQDKALFISVEVKKVLSRMTGMEIDQIHEEMSLTDDLHLTNLQLRALAVPFTHIATHFNPEAVISPDECEECETVEDCIKLVNQKTN